MAKQTDKKVEKPEVKDTVKVLKVPEVKDVKEPEIPKVVEPETKGKKGEVMEKVKFIKDMPRLYIVGDYYEAKKDDTKMLPKFVAQIVRGDGGKRETFAV